MVTFQEIMTQGIIFYDKEYRDECTTFCQLRSINYLPSLHNEKFGFYYNSDEQKFTRKRIMDTQRVGAEASIYDNKLISRFREFGTLFVEQNHVIKGVVHFSDYNRSAVYDDIYKQLYLLERGLVHLITHNASLTKRDLFEFMDKHIPSDGDQPLSKKDFRARDISLWTILKFTQEHKLVKISENNIQNIISIRNKIAHSYDLISKQVNDTLHYQEKSFTHLIHGMNSLRIATRQVSNRLYLMKAVLDENFLQPVLPLHDFLERS